MLDFNEKKIRIMKKIIINVLLITLITSGFISCKDALDIEPRQSIDATTALTSKDGINAAVVSVYSRMKGVRMYGRDIIALPEALADNGFATNKSGRLLNEANNVFRAHFLQDTWQISYSAINQANLIIETVPGVEAPGITVADKTFWLGQMYFLRGLYHFNLALAYAYIPGAVVSAQNKGGVPIMLKGTASSTDALALKPTRAPIDDVYAQIVKDLESANLLLTFPGSSFPNLANKAAAQALLARVNLYRKDYAAALH
jgi:starch-binding outer membrane protein, SusD/RagB family